MLIQIDYLHIVCHGKNENGGIDELSLVEVWVVELVGVESVILHIQRDFPARVNMVLRGSESM